MSSVLYYTLQFLLGGVSVVGIALIVRYIHPKYAGILYGLPVILIVAMIFVYLDNGLEVSRKTLKSAFVYEFTLVYFVLAFYLLLQKMGFWQSMVFALVSWGIIATVIQFFLKA